MIESRCYAVISPEFKTEITKTNVNVAFNDNDERKWKDENEDEENESVAACWLAFNQN